VDFTVVWNFATAILIGALLGIERERHKREHDDLSIGGLRTFILFALIGALGGWLTLVLSAPWILAAALLATQAPVLAGYVLSARARPDALGMTTELAAVAAFLLGALATLGQRELAVGLGVTVAALLAYKQPLHGIVLRLDREDVYAGLRLLIATFIVLPLLPDRTIDPWGALNPRTLWMLVLLISSLSLVGYVATRLLGADRGIPLTGLTGGLSRRGPGGEPVPARCRAHAIHRHGRGGTGDGVVFPWPGPRRTPNRGGAADEPVQPDGSREICGVFCAGAARRQTGAGACARIRGLFRRRPRRND
jgi:hypothetical protein